MHDKDEIRILRPDALPRTRLICANIRKFRYRPHAHEEYAIGVVGSGIQQFVEPSGQYAAETGTVYTLNPGDVHAGKAATDRGYAYRLVYIPSDFLHQLLEIEAGSPPRHLHFCNRLTKDTELAPSLLRLLTRMEDPFASPLAVESELVLLLQSLFSRHSEFSKKGSLSPSASAVRKVKQMIQSRYADPLTLSEMAQTAGLSRYHFIRVFQNATGLSPHAYLTQERVFHARDAIEQGNSLADTALMTGFSDQSHMTRQFKSIIGTTPGRFRKTIR